MTLKNICFISTVVSQYLKMILRYDFYKFFFLMGTIAFCRLKIVCCFWNCRRFLESKLNTFSNLSYLLLPVCPLLLLPICWPPATLPQFSFSALSAQPHTHTQTHKNLHARRDTRTVQLSTHMSVRLMAC